VRSINPQSGFRMLRNLDVRARAGTLLEEEADTPVALGIDASLTSYGLSAVSERAHLTLRFCPKLRGVRRLDEIYEFVYSTVENFCAAFDVQHIVMEDYAPGVQGRRHAIGEGGGVTKLALYHLLGDGKRGFPTLVAPTALKKFVTGRGNAKKNEILLAVYRKWGVEFANDDMADAYSLARMGLGILSKDTLLAYEAEVLASLERHNEWDPQTK
jgi:Holliday junction resolvasome RuvABC endonuclease subunit